MSPERFLTKLKSCSTRFGLCGLSLVFLLNACTSAAPKPVREPRAPQQQASAQAQQPPKGGSEAPVPVRREIPVPPWEVYRGVSGEAWRASQGEPPEFSQARLQLKEGELEQAALLYRQVALRAEDVQTKRAATLRLASTQLKLGQGKDALDEVSRLLRDEGQNPQDADRSISRLVIYAYLQQQNYDQALAWLSMSHRRTTSNGGSGADEEGLTRQVVRGLNYQDFSRFEDRWSADPFVSKVMTSEKLRRAQGGASLPAPYTRWFDTNLYRPYGDAPIAVVDGGPPIDGPDGVGPGESAIVGIILPLNGRYAPHAEQVKRGIELAVSLSPYANQVELIVSDSEGMPVEAEASYRRLANEKGAKVVLGPLLSKSAENVARSSEKFGVPFITFTKRAGIPELGSTVFRLGATSESQVEELARYASGQLGVSTVSMIYPETPSGREFASLFRREAQKNSLMLVREAGYTAEDELSIDVAVEALLEQPVQAIFIPDSLENAFPLLDRLQTSELNEAILLGPAYWNDPVAVRGYGQLLDGAVFVAPFYQDSTKQNVRSFVESYRRAYESEPGLLAAQGFDAAQLALEALFGSRGGESVTDLLRSVDTVYGVTGRLEVSGDGEISRRMSVLRLDRGNLTEVMSSGVVVGFNSYGQKVERIE